MGGTSGRLLDSDARETRFESSLRPLFFFCYAPKKKLKQKTGTVILYNFIKIIMH